MNYIVDSVDSALVLLSYVAEHPGLGVSELAKRLDMNKSKTYRMLCTLELHRFVMQDEKTSTYALGPQALVIGIAASQQNTLVRSAQKHMLALNQAINESVVLRVREGLETVSVARYETTHEIRVMGVVGNRRPLNSGASGKVLLAYAPQAVKVEFLAQLQKQVQSDRLAQLSEELDDITQNKYSISVGEVTAGAVAISVPVYDIGGNVLAALSISGPVMRIHATEHVGYIKKLRDCSHAISTELGYTAPE